jgi:hypothetical protein
MRKWRKRHISGAEARFSDWFNAWFNAWAKAQAYVRSKAKTKSRQKPIYVRRQQLGNLSGTG